jgi:hypothetical protein
MERLEIGIHRFHHPGRPEDGAGDAKFVTLWQNKDGAWKVTRVISYNHNLPGPDDFSRSHAADAAPLF